MTSRLLRTSQVAERLGIDQGTVNRYIREGRLVATETAGGHYRVTENAVESFLRSQTHPTPVVPRILAVANQKGGVGKSTTAATLGAEAADRGLRVLLVDMDHQASLTRLLGFNPPPTSGTLYDLIEQYVSEEAVPDATQVIRPLVTGEHLIASNIKLAMADSRLQSEVSGETVIKDLLEPLTAHYDIIILDCPPTLTLLTLNDLTAATEVLIPVQPEYLAVQGILDLQNTIARVQRRLNKELRVAGVLITMFRKSTSHHRERRDEIAAEMKRSGIAVLGTVPDAIMIPDAAGAGQAITRLGDSEAARVYRELADQLFGVATHG